jgi:acyl carrier protein
MRNQRYELVLEVVRRVLRVDPLDVHRDFFDLGANSLALMQMVSRVQQECGAAMSLADALDAPDIDAFVRAAVERWPSASDESPGADPTRSAGPWTR